MENGRAMAQAVSRRSLTAEARVRGFFPPSTSIFPCQFRATGADPQWPRGLRRGSVAVRLLGLWVRIPPGAWMFVLCLLYKD